MNHTSPDDVVATHAAAAANAREPLLVLDPLREFLAGHGLVRDGELQVAPIGDGHSNVTYLLRSGPDELVLRRPPRGPLPRSAHDVVREARLLRALAPTGTRVPRVLAIGEDASIIGAPFYVMAYVAGEVVTDSVPAALDTPAQRRRMSEELVDALVEVHAVDWRAHGLEDFSHDPDGYLERQLRRFGGLWEQLKTREIAAVEDVGAWLRSNVPRSGPATIVHGDYRLGNTMMAADPPVRLVAIFDWEMATVGDPLADLGYLCALWVQRGDPPLPALFEFGGTTRANGFLTRDELVARYEQRSGRSMTDIRWYRTLALWKAAVFMEGNYRRAISGSTDDPWLKGFGDGVAELAERALELTRGEG